MSVAHAEIISIEDARARYDAGEPAPATHMTMIEDSAFDHAMSIGAHALAVYCYLERRSGRTGRCSPSYQRMADDLRLSRSTAIRTVRTLVSEGLVQLTKRTRRSGDADSNEFFLPLHRTDLGSVTDTPGSVRGSVRGSVTDTPKVDTSNYQVERDARETPPPAHYDLTDGDRAFVARYAIPDHVIPIETDLFLSWHRTKHKTSYDWGATWQTWMIRAKQRADANGGWPKPPPDPGKRRVATI